MLALEDNGQWNSQADGSLVATQWFQTDDVFNSALQLGLLTFYIIASINQNVFSKGDQTGISYAGPKVMEAISYSALNFL